MRIQLEVIAAAVDENRGAARAVLAQLVRKMREEGFVEFEGMALVEFVRLFPGEAEP